MVTKATNNTAGKPFMELDLQKFAQNRTHTAEEVRNVLESHIRKAIEIPEDLGDDRAAREAYLRKRKEEVAYKNACDELDVYQKNPELYTTLYALKNATNAETVSEGEGDRAKESERANARICEDQNGNLFLAVDIMKPTDISFQIHDGKLYFDPSGMTPDRLKEMLAYLDRRGLASFIDMDSLKLENADQTTGEMFAAAKDDIKQEIGRQGEDRLQRRRSAGRRAGCQRRNSDTGRQQQRQRRQHSRHSGNRRNSGTRRRHQQSAGRCL